MVTNICDFKGFLIILIVMALKWYLIVVYTLYFLIFFPTQFYIKVSKDVLKVCISIYSN